MEHRHSWHKISFAIGILILILIPTARSLEHLASVLTRAEPALNGIMLSLGAIITLTLAANFLLLLFQRTQPRWALLWIVLISACLSVTISQLLVPIEAFHIALYGSLTAALFLGFRQARSFLSAAALAILVAAFVSLLDEGLQWLHPERVGDPRDLLLNGLSSLCGLACVTAPSSEPKS